MFHVPASESVRGAGRLDQAGRGNRWNEFAPDRGEAALHCHGPFALGGEVDAMRLGEGHRRDDIGGQRVAADRGIAGDDDRHAERQVDGAGEVDRRPVALVARHGDLDADRGGARLAAGPVDARCGAGIHLGSGDVEQRERGDRVLFASGHRLLRIGQPQPRGARRRGGQVTGPLGVEPRGDRRIARGAQPLDRGVIEQDLAGAQAGAKERERIGHCRKPRDRQAELVQVERLPLHRAAGVDLGQQRGALFVAP